LRLKCPNFDYGWGSSPDPAGGAHSAPPYVDLRGPTSKGKEGSGTEKGRDKRGKGEGSYNPLHYKFLASPLTLGPEERSTTRQVNGATEWTEVLRRE